MSGAGEASGKDASQALDNQVGSSPVRYPDRLCMTCGASAPFGFNTRRGETAWTCMAHRANGEKVLVPPAWTKRQAV